MDALDSLVGWMEDNQTGNVWTPQEAANPPYFTKDAGGDKGINFNGTPVLYDFDLQIASDTPADFYDLAFVLAGKGQGLWAQEEHFYVHVVPEPSPSLLAAVALAAIAALRRSPGLDAARGSRGHETS